jgi:outer membrane protein, adhesin transport system
MKKRLLLASVLGMTLTCGVEAETLHEVVIKSMTSGPELESAFHSKKSAEQDLVQSYSAYLPVLNLSTGYGTESSSNVTTQGLGFPELILRRTDANLTVTQKLFDGFQTKNAVKANLYRTQSAAYTVLSTAQDTALKAVYAYLDVLEKQRLLRLAEENLKEHQSLLARIEIRTKSGVGRAADLDQAQGRFALARTNYMSEQANERDAQTHFYRLVGSMPQDLYMPVLPENSLPETQESAVLLALSENPDVRLSGANVSSAAAASRGAYSTFFPTVNVEWSGTRNNNVGGQAGQTQSDSMMVRLNYNPFNGGADKAKVRQASEEFAKTQNSRTIAQRDVQQKVRLAWNSFTTASEQLKYYAEHTDSAARTRDAYHKQFSIGQRTLIDLLDAENELYQAKKSQVSAKFKKLTGEYQLLAATGRLLPVLDIPIPQGVEVRDPGVIGVIFGVVAP